VKPNLERLEERTVPSFTPIAQPVASYTAATTLIPITVPDGTPVPTLADAHEAVTFSSTMFALTAPSVSWNNWGSPPNTESATPRLLGINPVIASLTLTLSAPATEFGVELQTNQFGAFTLTADFFDGATLVGSISRTVTTPGVPLGPPTDGALLFAASSDQAFTRVVLSAPSTTGFGLAQVRYFLPAPTTTTVSNSSTTYNSTTFQPVTFNADVTSPGGTVNTGVVTFSVPGLGVVGADVNNGSASAVGFPVPAGFAAGSYPINATYVDGVDFQGSTATTPGTLTVNSANSGTSVTNVATFFNGHAQIVTLTAHVTSSNGGTVNEGNVTFTVDGLPSVTASVDPVGGAAVAFALPAGFPVGTYAIVAVYNDVTNANKTVNFIPSVGLGSFIVRATNGLVVNGLVEGMNSGLRAVAAITAPQDNNPANFTALINWGDGSTPTLGLITFDAVSGNFTIFGSHTYAEEGSFTTTTTLLHNGAFDTTATGVAIVSDPAVVPGPGTTVSLPEANGTQSVTLATFTDPGGAEALVDYSADIAWGDGSTTSGTITFNAITGVFSVSGTHAFADEGKFSVTVALHHDMAPTATVTDLLLATEADVLGDGPTTPVVTPEGAAFSGHVAVFTDTNLANVPGDFAATIDWGDGSPTDTGTVSGGNGLFTVSGKHTYVEENVYNLNVTLVDTDDDGSGLATAQHTVHNVAIVTEVPIVPVGGFTVTATEGTASTSQPVATFTDPAGAEALSSYSADIAWGDSSTTAGTITFDASSGTFTVSGSHNYADEGQFSLAVTIHHETAPAATVNSIARASEADLLAPAPGQPTVAPVEGMSFSGAVAAFTDSGYPGNIAADFTATIDWGDGSPTDTGTVSGGGGQFSVSGTHTYVEEGSFTLSVTLTDKDDDGSGLASASATASAMITVSDPAVDATGGLTVTAVEGNSSGNQTVATFTDPAGAEDVAHYSADVNWGDSTTTAGAITFDASTGVFSVQGSHTYAEEGTDTISVTIHHEMATSVSVTSTANVADAALTAHGTSVSVEEGMAVNGTVATFTDANPGATLSDFTASINWGDGTTTDGTVTTNPSGGFDVTGKHTYTENGQFTASISIHDVGGQNASATTTVNVTEPGLVGTPTPMVFFEGSATNRVLATFTHAGSESATSFTASINWGDGTTTAGTIVLAADGTTFQVFGTHTYADETRPNAAGQYIPTPVQVTISEAEQGGTSIDVQSSATIVETMLPDGTRGTANQRFLSEVYHDLLEREIDTNGLASWGALLDHGVSRTQVVFDITQSTEYREDEINGVYLRYLKREADPTGLANALSFLQHGGTIEQVAENVILSNEFAAKVGSSTTQAFMNQVYLDTFNRPIDQPGLNDVEAKLGPGPVNINSPMLRMVIDNIFTSDEYIDDLVRSFYNTLMPQKFLDRNVELDPGFIAWTNFLKQAQFFPNRTDENAIAGICGFVEYFSKTQS
jgi:hypothetical protein